MAVKKTKVVSKIPALASRGATAPAPARVPTQLDSYEGGIRTLHAARYGEAKALFDQAAKGPDRGIAHRARIYARMCEGRLEQPTALPQSAEEHYNYGIALLNARELAAARDHLQAALALDSGADHVHYALAVCYGLSGDISNAYESLKRAIELQPRNRIMARQDADFAPIAGQAPLDRLVYPEKKSPC